MPARKKTAIIEQTPQEIALDNRQKMSWKDTPKQMIKKKGDGFDYVETRYMRHMLDKAYPDWSWLPSPNNAVQFLGSEWVIVSGVLEVTDNDLGAKRRMFMPGAARIQFKKNQPHTPENVVDIDKNVASANSYAFKRAVNRLTHIADDVYRYQVKDDFLTETQKRDYLSLLDMAKDNGMAFNRITKYKNHLQNLYQDSFDDVFNHLEKEVDDLIKNKTKQENKINQKEKVNA